MVRHWAWVTLLFAVSACSTGQRPVTVAPPSCTQVGLASWYRPGLHRTADGGHHGRNALIAAHRTLPFGTQVRVTDLDSGRSVMVRIDDRGPFVRGRIIDLSPEAARRLGMRHNGVVSVRLDIPDPGQAGGGCPFRAPGSA